jgi:Na+/H+-dicarboxylate symporter
MASLMVEISDFSTLRALGIYGLTGIWLVHHGFVFYPTLLLIFAKVNPIKFFKAIAPLY